jgi:hypothetical protein
MTYVPGGRSFQVRDGQIGLSGALAAIPLAVGVSSAGTVSTLYYFTDPNIALDTLGYGPLTDLVMEIIREVGGCLALKLAGSVAAANSAVTPTRVGSSVGTITLSGSAFRDYRGAVQIRVSSDALGTGKFRYSLDYDAAHPERVTWSEEITIPSGGTYSPPNSGLTLTFVLGVGTPDFEAGDLHTWTSTCAHYNTTNVSDGMTALLASELLVDKAIEQVYWTGVSATASAAATLAAAIATHMGTLEDNDHFARCIMDGGSLDTTTNYLANFVAVFSDTRVVGSYGFAFVNTPAPIPGFSVAKVAGLDPFAVRACDCELSENPGRVKSGRLKNVVDISHDEEKLVAFSEAAKTITLRRNRKMRGGFYITNGYLKSPTGSDFLYWDWGRVVDRRSRIIVEGLAPWTLAKVRILTDGTGRLDPRDALSIVQPIITTLSAAMKGPTKDGLPSHVTEASTQCDTESDFASDRTVRITDRVVPTFPVEGFAIVMGLTRQLEAA